MMNRTAFSLTPRAEPACRRSGPVAMRCGDPLLPLRLWRTEEEWRFPLRRRLEFEEE